MKRLFILLALASPVNSAPLQCVVFDQLIGPCTVRYTTGGIPVVYVEEVPQFANGFED